MDSHGPLECYCFQQFKVNQRTEWDMHKLKYEKSKAKHNSQNQTCKLKHSPELRESIVSAKQTSELYAFQINFRYIKSK